MNARNIVLGVLAVLFLGAIVTILFTLYRPIGAVKTADSRHHIEQFEDFTCGPAAAVSALSWLNVTVTEREMVARFHCDRRGTWPEPMAAALGSRVQKKLPDSAPGRVFIVEIRNSPSTNHYVCAHGEIDGWTVDDPAKHEPEHWTTKDFEDQLCAIEVTK